MTDVEGWLQRYGDAWAAHDGVAAAALFSDDAIYDWGPFDRVEGPQAIRARWERATADQGTVRFDAQLLGRDGDRAFAHWKVAMREGAPDEVRLDGAFVLDFAADGRCRRLQEWWLVEPGSQPTFDFAAYRAAFEAADADRWLAFYAPDAEWLEYRHANPPRSPNIMRGHAEIEPFLRGIADAGLGLTIADEVVAGDRAAFAVTVALPDGRRILEHVILHLRDGLITRQVDVEAWD